MSEGRWDCQKNERVKRPDVDAFVEGVIALCKASGFSIAHEDSHGAFIVEPYSEENAEWLRAADVSKE